MSPFQHRVNDVPDRATPVAAEAVAASVPDDVLEVAVSGLTLLYAIDRPRFRDPLCRLELGHDLIRDSVEVRQLIEHRGQLLPGDGDKPRAVAIHFHAYPVRDSEFTMEFSATATAQ